MARDHGRDLYFLVDRKHGVVKVGRSGNLALRVRELTRWAETPLELAAVCEGLGELERHVHRTFSEDGINEHEYRRSRALVARHARKGGSGEWYRATPALLEFVEACARDPEQARRVADSYPAQSGAALLWEHMRDAGKSQTQLARELGVAQQTVSKWLLGETRPDAAACVRLSAGLGIPIDAWLDDGDAAPAPAGPCCELCAYTGGHCAAEVA